MALKIPPLLQVLIALLLMTLVHHLVPTFTLSFALSAYLASLLLVIAVSIGVLAIYNFRQHNTTVNPIKPELSSQVVDSGIYQYSRNPMYLAMCIALVAYAIYLENPLTLFVCWLFVRYISSYQIQPEERILTQLFGSAYRDYQARVRRWL
ncbi:Protein-S-isoprenylcysteine O-methyltransferase Ste14 [Colwellia chukchiensis]|uniref:Protein-S-isoprenylcysteine O-methyltransferase Ste14 n=1 Tax=Colwellia chukchiensis TaxID=641665 RepID=A0A1H7K8D1_9GAMM|nr:isoprenylcysteine carboxylmethyltransferase family protein [Colwellia chukchiensis]SEK82175.1 Protein-S-isoprenylcysteine O-methyltransferase Ste14 [Colwellia chukchiensis]